MASSNPTRFLASGGDDRALALKMFSDTVLESFRLSTKFYDDMGRIAQFKAIDAGKSWQYPIIDADPSPEYHIPGNELLGQTQAFGETIITIDDILVAHREVPLDQRLLSHFDVMVPYARAIGRSLAIDIDNKMVRTSLLAARTGASGTFHNGGNVVANVNGTGVFGAGTRYTKDSTGAANARNDIRQLARLMDEDNVPETGRILYVVPEFREVLSYDSTLFSRDYSPDANAMHNRNIALVEGFEIVVSNAIPSTNQTAGNPPSNATKYNVNCAYAGSSSATGGRPVAVALCGASENSGAIGMVQAQGFASVVMDDERRNTTFMKTQTFFGLGVIRPWCAGEIRVAAA